MSSLIKYVRTDGDGDYTSISTAFNAMVVSGLASSGDISDYYLLVDSGIYNDTISGHIPYSGNFNIIGSKTIWDLSSPMYISGEYINPSVPNLTISNFTLLMSGITSYFVNVPSGFTLKLSELDIIDGNYGVNNNGSLIINDVNGYFSATGVFTENGYLYADNLNLNLGNRGLYAINSNINLINCSFNEFYPSLYFENSATSIDRCQFSNNWPAITDYSGNLYISNSTIYDRIVINNTLINVDKSIFYYSSTYPNFHGTAQSGSLVSNSCIFAHSSYPSGYTSANISGVNNKYADPLLISTSYFNQDFGLQYKETDGSPCIEFQNTNQFPSGVDISLDNASLKIYDENGNSELYRFLPYIYKQGSSIILSDYGKEVQFAKDKAKFKNIKYNLLTTAEFSETGVLTKPSFDKDINKPDSKPYDWDYKHFQTTRIGYNENYVVPRSYISLPEILIQKLGIDADDVLYQDITKQHIKVYEKQRYRGVAYDYTLSKPTEAVIWIVNGNNQSLIKQNSFTGEELDEYPLLCPTATKTHIKLSGVVYVGVDGDSYKYRNFNNPNEILLSENDQGFFQWICPDINTKYDVRGIVSNKDYIYITASDYQTQDILNRSSIPSGQPIGKVLWYNNNDLFYNYTKKPNEINGPLESNLALGNYYPTDITVYEDGSLMIADYHSASGIYKYKRTYDYALVTSSYDDGSRILLRENYNDINI